MNATAIILACGQGRHLGILSQKRVSSAVPFAGKYRVIDFVLSNCANSDIRLIGVLTQYRPRSLNEHIGTGRPWDLDRTFSAGVTLLPAYQGKTGAPSWYCGTADAVYQNLDFIRVAQADTVLILSGDQIYKMDYNPLLRYHHKRQADATVAVFNVQRTPLSRFHMLTNDASIRGPSNKRYGSRDDVAPMGIYVFQADVLAQRLTEDAQLSGSTHDIAKDVLPRMFQLGDRIQPWSFGGYWTDITTVHTYWEANMELLSPDPPLNLLDPNWCIHTRGEERPPANILPCAAVSNSLVTDGCIIEGQVEGSVLSPGVRVRPGAVVHNSIIFSDCDIGPNAALDRAILDKNVVVGADVRVGVSVAGHHPSRIRSVSLSGSITLVGKNTCLPTGLHVGCDCIIGGDLTEDDFTTDLVSDGQCIGLKPSDADAQPVQDATRDGHIRGASEPGTMVSRAWLDSPTNCAQFESQESKQDVPFTGR